MKRCLSELGSKPVNRRVLLQMGAAAALLHSYSLAADASPALLSLPTEVAGIGLPRSALALNAARLAHERCPEFLFNHCMRTFLFGALLLQRRRLAYQADDSFVASALHDLGLLPSFESAQGSFEIDGADAAEKFMLAQRRSTREADQVWHAVEMHDGAWALTARQGPEAMLVALGAGADAYGLDPGELEAGQIAEVLTAFPRRGFKQRFTALLIAHCRRKPASQRATWLEGLCRAHAPDAQEDSVEQHIAAADFPD